MARTRIDIANRALAILVRDPIQSFEGNTPEQIFMKQFVDSAVEYVISEFPVPAARVRTALTSVSGITIPGWSSIYMRPADAVRIWEVSPLTPDKRTAYPYEEMLSPDIQENTTYICTNLANAYMTYSSSRVDIGRLTSHQFELAAYKLAEMSCMPLKKDKELFAFLGQEVLKKTAHEAALVFNSEVEEPDIDFIPEAIQVRSL